MGNFSRFSVPEIQCKRARDLFRQAEAGQSVSLIGKGEGGG